MGYRDNEAFGNGLVTLLPAIQLAHNTSNHSTTGKTPSLLEKALNLLFPVDHFKKNLLTINPTARDFHGAYRKASDTAEKFFAEVKESDKQRYDKTHNETEFREGDRALVSSLNFNNL
ncbi:hypothetical protein O181_003234 [Austropuccinia psidii MF-1]|uniref:Integrase catalytic domain-containing protein n=1 Tax=Austropuccinia psidii MF-1 TaxID=1389203 RepID=A0A9Q3BDZ6_9BASI|nr:hypothetical protein [Austropuccinia psidii MF-1]